MAQIMRQREAYVRAGIMLFFFTLVYEVSVNFFSMEWYRGSSRGFEVVASDIILLGLAIYVSGSPPRGSLVSKSLCREKVFLWMYALVGLISCVTAFVPIYAAFGFWKLMRGVLVFHVFYKLIDRRERVEWLLIVYGAMVLYQVPWVVLQKYGMGIYRATGTLPHMNTLAMLNNALMVPLFGVLFLEEERPPRKWILFVVAGAVFNVLSTASRGALVSMLMAMTGVMFFLRPRLLNTARSSILIFGFVGAIIVALQAMDTIIERFNEAPAESEETRDGFNICAAWLARDFMFGCGLNNYSHAIGKTRYGEAAPDLPNDGGKDDGVAHHIYWLTASEMGWIGLVVFVAFLGVIQLRCLTLGFASKDRLYGALGVGAFGGLMALHLQGFLEWVLRQTLIWYVFLSQAALLAAMARMDKDQRKGLLPSPHEDDDEDDGEIEEEAGEEGVWLGPPASRPSRGREMEAVTW